MYRMQFKSWSFRVSQAVIFSSWSHHHEWCTFVLSLLACRAHDLWNRYHRGWAASLCPAEKAPADQGSAALNPPSWGQMVKKSQIPAENNFFVLCEIISGKEIEAEDKPLSWPVHPCLISVMLLFTTVFSQSTFSHTACEKRNFLVSGSWMCHSSGLS